MRSFLRYLFAAALFLLPPALALGQATQSFSPTALPATLSVSNSSARVVLPSPGPTALVINTGASAAYLNFGSSAVTATTGGYLLSPGCATAFNVSGQTYVAAITASSTTTLSIATGAGLPTLPPNACVQTVTITSGNVTTTPGQRTLVTLDIKTVTTGGTAVAAISAGHRTAGGFLQNPIGATVALCINEIGTATGTTSSGDTTCIQPGQSYTVAPASTAVSVITSDSTHPFSGYGQN